MASRLLLQTLLENILGSRNVYYQPPESIKMLYPAIRYSRNNIRNIYADGSVYAQNHSYTLIVIDPDPDSVIVQRISKLKNCKFDRHYVSEGLNHDVFTLYF